MLDKNSWLNISGETRFMQVGGVWQRVRALQTVTGDIADNMKVHFESVKDPAPVEEKIYQPDMPSIVKDPVAPAPPKATKKELKAKIKAKGGKYTNFMNAAQLEAVLAKLDKKK